MIAVYGLHKTFRRNRYKSCDFSMFCSAVAESLKLIRVHGMNDENFTVCVQCNDINDASYLVV